MTKKTQTPPPQTFSVQNENGKTVTWRHAGGKLRRLGPHSLSDKELLAILIGSGNQGLTAEQIASQIIDEFHSLHGLMGRQLSELMKIKGLKEVKATKIASAFEIARRIIKALENE